MCVSFSRFLSFISRLKDFDNFINDYPRSRKVLEKTACDRLRGLVKLGRLQAETVNDVVEALDVSEESSSVSESYGSSDNESKGYISNQSAKKAISCQMKNIARNDRKRRFTEFSVRIASAIDDGGINSKLARSRKEWAFLTWKTAVETAHTEKGLLKLADNFRRRSLLTGAFVILRSLSENIRKARATLRRVKAGGLLQRAFNSLVDAAADRLEQLKFRKELQSLKRKGSLPHHPSLTIDITRRPSLDLSMPHSATSTGLRSSVNGTSFEAPFSAVRSLTVDAHSPFSAKSVEMGTETSAKEKSASAAQKGGMKSRLDWKKDVTERVEELQNRFISMQMTINTLSEAQNRTTAALLELAGAIRLKEERGRHSSSDSLTTSQRQEAVAYDTLRSAPSSASLSRRDIAEQRARHSIEDDFKENNSQKQPQRHGNLADVTETERSVQTTFGRSSEQSFGEGLLESRDGTPSDKPIV